MRTRHNVTLSVHSLSCHDMSPRTVCQGGSVCVFMFLHSFVLFLRRSQTGCRSWDILPIQDIVFFVVNVSVYLSHASSSGYFPPEVSLHVFSTTEPLCCPASSDVFVIFRFVPLVPCVSGVFYWSDREYFPLSTIYVSSRKFCIFIWYKSISVQAWTGCHVYRNLRPPVFNTFGTRRWQDCQPYAPAAFTPTGNTPGTHFCCWLSWTQGHSAAGKDTSMKNSSDTIGNRTRALPTCSAVSQFVWWTELFWWMFRWVVRSCNFFVSVLLLCMPSCFFFF